MMLAGRNSRAASSCSAVRTSRCRAGAAAGSVVDDRDQAFSAIKSKKPEWSDEQINAYLDANEVK